MALYTVKRGPFSDTQLAQFLRGELAPTMTPSKAAKVAQALGYARSDIVSLFLSGHAKVPLDKITALAEVIGADPLFVLRLGLEQYWPAGSDVLQSALTKVVSKNEQRLVDVLRETVGRTDFALADDVLVNIRSLITEAFAQRNPNVTRPFTPRLVE